MKGNNLPCVESRGNLSDVLECTILILLKRYSDVNSFLVNQWTDNDVTFRLTKFLNVCHAKFPR